MSGRPVCIRETSLLLADKLDFMRSGLLLDPKFLNNPLKISCEKSGKKVIKIRKLLASQWA
jgi:hypothetical protein